MTTLNTVTSSTRPSSPTAGDAYFETDTNKIIVWNGSAWTEIIADTKFNHYSLSFDNTDDVAKADSSLTLSRDAAWSFSFWLNRINPTSDYDNTRDFMSNGRSRFRIVQNLAGTSNAVRFYDDGGAVVDPSTGATTGAVATTNSTTFNFNDSWNHILITSDGTNAVYMYINGIQQTGGTGTLLSDVSLIGSDLFVMGQQSYPGRAIALDEIAVFNSDLSSNASDLYNNGVATDLNSYNPLIWWRMEEGSGSTVVDSGTDGSIRRDLTLSSSTEGGDGPTFLTDTP